MVNILAEHGIRQLDTVEAVRIYVGGLPQNPEPPLNYQIVYSLEGVLDYYTTLSWVLRDGKRTQVKALSEREPVAFPTPVGELEAFHTAGGLSTMAFRYEGKIPTMEYKTLRYPGPRGDHGGDSRARPARARAGGREGAARSCRAMSFSRGDGSAADEARGRDLVALRVTVRGTKDGKPKTRRVGAGRLLRRGARHQRDDAHDRLLALDHGPDAGAGKISVKRSAHAG